MDDANITRHACTIRAPLKQPRRSHNPVFVPFVPHPRPFICMPSPNEKSAHAKAVLPETGIFHTYLSSTERCFVCLRFMRALANEIRHWQIVYLHVPGGTSPWAWLILQKEPSTPRSTALTARFSWYLFCENWIACIFASTRISVQRAFGINEIALDAFQ